MSETNAELILDGTVPATPHPRQRIRASVVVLLRRSVKDADGVTRWATSVGARVFDSRTAPLLLKSLPAIAVYTGVETIDKEHSALSPAVGDIAEPRQLRRLLQLHLEIVAANSPIADQFDQIAWQVEAVMENNPKLGSLVDSMMLTGCEPAFVSNQEGLIGALRLTYELAYYTPAQFVTGSADPAVKDLWIGLAPDIGAAHKDDYVEVRGA
jgi:hypothetical protein